MINHCLFNYNYLNEKEIEILWSKHHASLTKVAEEKSLNKLTMLEAVENVTAVVFNIYKRDLHEHLCNQQIPLLQDLLHGVCDSSKLDSFKNYPVLKYLVVENKGKCKLMDELLEVFILKHYFFDNDGYYVQNVYNNKTLCNENFDVFLTLVQLFKKFLELYFSEHICK
ncbi:hypothetical protein ABK040_012651 [Willaertia magna]